LSTDRGAFDVDVKRFTENLAAYHQAIIKALESVKANFEERLVKEYLPKWQTRPPANFARYGVPPTKSNLEQQLRELVRNLLQTNISFEPPRVRVIYKNIAPESVRDAGFLDPLQKNHAETRRACCSHQFLICEC
jgi:hypothetical protein